MASRLAILQDQRKALRAEQSALVAAAEAAPSPDATMKALAASDPRRAEIEASLVRVDAEIMAEATRREAERNAPSDGGGDPWPSILGHPGVTRTPRATGARTYAAMFDLPKLEADGFAGFDDFLGTIHRGRADERLLAAAGTMSGTVGSDGGFLVPTQFSAELLDGAIESEIVRPRATVYPMTSDERKISGFSAKDHTGGSIYGFQPVWLAEGGAATNQKGSTVQMTLRAQKLALFAQAFNELVADGQDFESQLGTAITASVGFGLDVAFLSGTGAGVPLGVLNDPALVTVAAEAGQTADTIMYENLVKMLSRLHPALLGESVWLASQTAIPQLTMLSVPIGVGGAAVPVMTRAGGGFEILTRPVVFTEKVPVVGDKGDLSLVAFSQYAVGLRKEVVLDRSNAPGWSTDATNYRAIIRVDGRGRWSGPVTPLHGDTLSWCVTLAAR
jgi:HK97 family phage major capsid protein